MATVVLMGPPGSGKSLMAGLTAPSPVHFVDIDRKVQSTARFKESILSGEITFREIGETLTETNLGDRLKQYIEDKSGILKGQPPKGWLNFANYMGSIEKDEQAGKAKTVVIDTYTQLSMHMWAYIQHMRGKGKFIWDDWNIWKHMWTETTNALIDYARATEKHIIICLHERFAEKPGEDTMQVRITTGPKGEKSKDYLGGKLDVKVAASIEGSFGLDFGTYFTDVYRLRVDVSDSGEPTWKCRVHPDGQSDLRCSFPSQSKDGKLIVDFDPDFRKIWGKEWK